LISVDIGAIMASPKHFSPKQRYIVTYDDAIRETKAQNVNTFHIEMTANTI